MKKIKNLLGWWRGDERIRESEKATYDNETLVESAIKNNPLTEDEIKQGYEEVEVERMEIKNEKESNQNS